MTAPHILAQRQDEAVRRIEAHCNSIGGDAPEIAEAAERVQNVSGPDEVHERVFRLEAVADLLEAVDNSVSSDPAEDDLDALTKAELLTVAQEEGVEVRQSDSKDEIKDAIRSEREAS
jgi:hypothetical protein